MKDDIFYKTLLYDFYGELLTNNQKSIFDMYYNHDLSLSEISQNTGVSRQGIYDTLKRAESILKEFETKLKLVNRFIKQKCLIKRINIMMDCVLDCDFINNEELKPRLIEIKDIIEQLTEA